MAPKRVGERAFCEWCETEEEGRKVKGTVEKP